VIVGRRIQALAVDASKQLIYWTDTGDKVIRRAMVPSDVRHQAHSQSLRSGSDIVAPRGIAFDWVTK
jgi:hypothetical protein